jgi:uncharacterized RDD family membrane protein YckC
MIYAGFWKRVAALIIDTIITTIGGFAIGVVFGFIWGAAGMYDEKTFGQQGMLLGLIIYWLYFALMESSSNQATLGKRALGIKVTDLNGDRISFGKATGRHFGKFLSSIILCIGYIMVAFTQKKQGLHDIMAGCLVVNSDVEFASSDRYDYVQPEPIYKPLPSYESQPPVELGKSSVSLFCYSGELKGNTIPVPAQGIVIGRDPAKCQIVLSSNELSRLHVSIMPDRANPRSIVVSDMQSTNGTFQQVQDSNQKSRWMRINDSVVLGPGRRFRIGKDVAEFEVR